LANTATTLSEPISENSTVTPLTSAESTQTTEVGTSAIRVSASTTLSESMSTISYSTETSELSETQEIYSSNEATQLTLVSTPSAMPANYFSADSLTMTVNALSTFSSFPQQSESISVSVTNSTTTSQAVSTSNDDNIMSDSTMETTESYPNGPTFARQKITENIPVDNFASKRKLE